MSMINSVFNDANNTLFSFGKEQKSQSLHGYFSQLVNEKKLDIIARLQSGSTEQGIQIGAGVYTDSEWKRLLNGFDTMQAKLRNSTEDIKNEKAEPKAINAAEDSEYQEKSVELLLAEFTTATYSSNVPQSENTTYYTYYLPDGIYCRKQGQDGFEWQIRFEDKSQYGKVMDFLQSIDLQDNLLFASHENFWQDFLSGEIDMDKFSDFLDARVVDGVPNYLNEYENGITVDKEAASYSRYMNVPDFVTNVCYTVEEMFRTFQLNLATEGSKAGHEEIDLNRIDLYYAKHPDEIGKRNQYYNGHWYSWAELAQILLKESEELFSQNSGVNRSSPNFTAYYS